MRDPLDDFIEIRLAIIDKLEALQALADDHFHEDPDEIAARQVDRVRFIYFLLRLAHAIAQVRT